MNKPLFIIAVALFSLGAFLFVGCESRSSDATGDPLVFYIISDEPIEGGWFIDIQDFRDFRAHGYITPLPDLIIDRLAAVGRQIAHDQPRMVYAVETRDDEPVASQGALHIRMYAADAGRFAAFSEKAIEKQVLVAVGDRLLAAPWMMERISGGNLVVYLYDSEIDEVEEALEKLVRRSPGR